jgi:DNA-binding MarR family transcriptional regulator
MQEKKSNRAEQIQYIVNSLTKRPWRKNEIAVLTAKRSGTSERTARKRLANLEQRDVIETVQINRTRVFIKLNDDHEVTFDFETEEKSKVQALLEEANQIANSVVRSTFPVRSNYDAIPNPDLLLSPGKFIKMLKKNKLPPKKLKSLEKVVKQLYKISESQFIVIHSDQYIEHVFDIFDCIIFLAENYNRIDNTEQDINLRTRTTKLDTVSENYIFFLRNLLSNAGIVGDKCRYEPQIYERIERSLPTIETGPDFFRREMYYFTQTHGNISQKIESFILKIKNQDGENYDEYLSDAQSLYTEEQKDELRTRLRDIADEFDSQQRRIIEILCTDLGKYNENFLLDDKVYYYNTSKRKILATLSHGSKKLEDIHQYTNESKATISSNITSLSNDEYVNKVEGKNGYYKLSDELQKLFKQKRNSTPEPDREKVNNTLENILEWHKKYMSATGTATYENDAEMIYEHLIDLHDFAHNYSFSLDLKSDMGLFFDILDANIKELQKRGRGLPYLEDPVVLKFIFPIAGIFHNRWYEGLENIRYHSKLSERLDDLKQAHEHVHPDTKKFIRGLISDIDFDEADKIFKQSVSEGQGSIEDFKHSIDSIYFSNNQMDTVVDFLTSTDNDTPTDRKEVKKELLDYCIAIPNKSQF